TRPVSGETHIDRPNTASYLEVTSMAKPTNRYPVSSRANLEVMNDPDLAKFAPASVEAEKAREHSRRELEKWREHTAMRNAIVLEAVDAGLTDSEISVISGIARTTIARIIAHDE